MLTIISSTLLTLRWTTRCRGQATDIEPASLEAGHVAITEDHRFEQYFFDAASADRITRLMLRFQKPLLLGVPSVALALQGLGRDFLLVDRDERFGTVLPAAKFCRMDLHRPERLADPSSSFDIIVVDPPFANVSPDQLRAAIDVLVASSQPAARPPLLVCYPIKRRAKLEAALGCSFEQRGPPLVYASGIMPDRIGLFEEGGREVFSVVT